MVYTGDRQEVPEVLRLSDLYQGSGSAEVEVKVLRDDGTGDILDQYAHRLTPEARREWYNYRAARVTEEATT